MIYEFILDKHFRAYEFNFV